MPASNRPTRAPTIYDVAAAAGVSPSTVSRAISNPGRVNASTVEHILSVAARIGYHAAPKTIPAARRSMTVALFLTDISNPVYPLIVQGCEDAAAAAGYSILVVNTNESPHLEQQAVTRTLANVDGVILTSSRMDDSVIRDLASQRPLVSVNRGVTGVRSVVLDNRAGATEALDHLVSLGHHRVGYLTGPATSWANRVRWRALSDRAKELGVEVAKTAAAPPTLDTGAKHAAHWQTSAASAVIAFNDLVAVGFIAGLAARGIVVPRDLSVVGFDNSQVASIVSPALTTIGAPLRRLAGSAVENVLGMIRGEDLHRTTTQVFSTTLVLRGTTAPPN